MNILSNKILLATALSAVCTIVQAQGYTVSQEKKRTSAAWELGVGGSLVNWNRVTVTGFKSGPGGYDYDLRNRHNFGGFHLYVARELNPWFYLDLQGTMGLPHRSPEIRNNKQQFMFMGGLGLQFRLSPLFESHWVEPYLRVGINYVHKDFDVVHTGKFKDDITGQASWLAKDTWNPKGRSEDKNNFFPITFGVGANAWLTDRFGLGVQGDYVMPLNKNLSRYVMASARVMWRIGGATKHPEPLTKYIEVERPVERVVERVVEKVVEKPTVIRLYDVITNVNFDFDKYTITPESEPLLDEAARILKEMPGENYFLITGFTDARGSDSYNITLSQNRARVIVEALEKRGVPTTMLKSRGVGKRATSVSTEDSDIVRRGDRKVTIERVTLLEYWNRLPKK